MTDHKHPALLAAERWFATEQTSRDLDTTSRSLSVLGWGEWALRSLARVAFVAGYEAGRKARGESVAAYCTAESVTLNVRAEAESRRIKRMALTVQSARVRILAAQVARGDDENPRD